MPPASFDPFFRAATGHPPYDYQRRLACGERNGRSETVWLAAGTDCRSQLISIPTGLGKTAAVVLAWLWSVLRRAQNEAAAPPPPWPRRLVYCLPMRTLVEQTRDEVSKWITKIQIDADSLQLSAEARVLLEWLVAHSPIILMGGEEQDEARRQWDIHPERPAILIGTQDMLLSRALNRGYGMSRYRWPMHFGLLNNDALWIMDETQLMGVSVETSAQLDGFRNMWPVHGRCPTWWMSATLDDARLATVDHPGPKGGWPRLTLSDPERSSGRPAELFTAKKYVAPCPITLSSAIKATYAKQLAELIATRHHKDTLTLVVVNRVSRAQEIFAVLTDKKEPLYDKHRVALVHSRFRRADRQRHESLLFGQGDRIVIATQAVEAGVDVSARLLITELAPWSSLVQRIGRCNRRAEPYGGEVLWVDIVPDAKAELLLPYSEVEIAHAQNAIHSLSDASPRSLASVRVQEKPVVRPVIRRRDIVDLFDTTPDLCGQDLDISRYIRDEQDNDVQLFWRAVDGDTPTAHEPPPHHDELCRVSIGDAVKFFGKNSTCAWSWNPLSEQWEKARAARPGAVYLVDVASGGYSEPTGWTGEPKDKPSPLPPEDGSQDSYAGNRLTFDREWQPLAEHTAKIVGEMDAICGVLAIGDPNAATLHIAALWHDVGKAHGEFQAMLIGNDASRQNMLWAKSANKDGKCRRPGFRHELASAIAWLVKGPADAPERDLVGYLIAAHHGKVRLSIRSLPDEQGNPDDSEALFARGIWHGDMLPPIPDLIAEPTTLDLRFMHMGESTLGPSWLARAITLRDRFAPFRLAFLETLLRAADARASQAESCAVKPKTHTDHSAEMAVYEDPAPYGAAATLSPAERSLVAEVVADGLNIQERFRPEPLLKLTGKGHYASGAVEEIHRARTPKSKGQKS